MATDRPPSGRRALVLGAGMVGVSAALHLQQRGWSVVLVDRKEPGRERPTYTTPPSFTLHEGDFGEGGIILITIMRSYGIDSDLSFRVVERPKIGQVRVVQDVGENVELLHLAENHEAAELWLARNGYTRARLEEITADEAGADAVEGRAAA